MISVNQALQIVKENVNITQQFEFKNVNEALGFVLYDDLISSINMPPFRQSAMDGYALNIYNKLTYKIVGTIKAGDSHHPKILPGEAVRIFTGAPVPESANAVIMQEKTKVENEKLYLESTLNLNENIRPIGEQVIKGKVALKQGVVLNPAAIAYISSLGITKVNVYKKPSIAILVTGNELVEPGTPLNYGQIYESNALMLTTALNENGYYNVTNHKVEDNYNHTLTILNNLILNHDVVLVSGGISVGDYDFVGKALNELGVNQLFYKVNQKPGKPLFFGKKEHKLIFALPGNPAAALSCFYMYVLVALKKLSGNNNYSMPSIKAKSLNKYIKNGDRAHFLKAIYSSGQVEILEGQNSSMLHTFALSNALVYIPETINNVDVNDEVDVILLPKY